MGILSSMPRIIERQGLVFAIGWETGEISLVLEFTVKQREPEKGKNGYLKSRFLQRAIGKKAFCLRLELRKEKGNRKKESPERF